MLSYTVAPLPWLMNYLIIMKNLGHCIEVFVIFARSLLNVVMV